jgi:hypothetical protein
MLKALFVITSLVFCAGALYAPPPTAEDTAQWRAFALRSASSLGRTAASLVLNAMPSSDDVVRYAGEARVLAESFAVSALRRLREPTAPTTPAQPSEAPPEQEPAAATPECRPRELDQLLQEGLLQKEQAEEAKAWISRGDIQCSPDAKLPRPWCDPRVQAVLRLIEEDRIRRGQPAPPLCAEDPASLPVR